MRLFDMHCDTISRCLNESLSLKNNKLHVDLAGAEFADTYIQCFAAFVPDTMNGDEAFFYFSRTAEKLKAEIRGSSGKMLQCKMPGDIERTINENRIGAVLTVENGKALGGRLENIEKMKALGVKMLTLTWNGENELGRGVLSDGKTGLTDYGKRAVPLLEAAGIVIDISHSSPELFYDTAQLAEKPFAASHSNAKSVCGHPRNLTDEQFMIICRNRGLVGINFYEAFLNDAPEKASMEDILRHTEHFLSLGGEDCIAMGSDFDGAELPHDMKGLESMADLHQMFLRKNYKESLLDKIFFTNASRFFVENNLL